MKKNDTKEVENLKVCIRNLPPQVQQEDLMNSAAIKPFESGFKAYYFVPGKRR